MFILAVLIGVYSYLILGLGLTGLLYKNYLWILTAEFLVLCIGFFKFTSPLSFPSPEFRRGVRGEGVLFGDEKMVRET